MSNIEIELNDEGIQELLKSSEMQSVLEQYANQLGVLHDEVKVYKKRSAIHRPKDGDNDANRKNN